MFELKGTGWLELTISDHTNKIKFNISYLCDPLIELLEVLNSAISNDEKCFTILFEGEPEMLFLTFINNKNLNKIVVTEDYQNCVEPYKRNDIKTTMLNIQFEDFVKNILKELTNIFLYKYCNSWYKNKERENKYRELHDLVTELMCNFKKKFN